MAIVMDFLSCHLCRQSVAEGRYSKHAVAVDGRVLFAVDEPCNSEGWWIGLQDMFGYGLVSLKAVMVHLIYYSWAARAAVMLDDLLARSLVHNTLCVDIHVNVFAGLTVCQHLAASTHCMGWTVCVCDSYLALSACYPVLTGVRVCL